MRRLDGLLWRVAAGLFVTFLLSPLIMVVLFAFSSRSLANFPVEALSLRWWWALGDYRIFPTALKNSLAIAFLTGVLAAVVGTMAAMGLAKLTPARARLGIFVLSLPLMLPPLVLAVALLTFYLQLGLKLGLLTVVASHLLFALPFVVAVVYARLASFDPALVESARDLGAGPLRAFSTVTLPIIRPTVVGAALIAMALSLDDFVITSFTIGNANTLPTMVWSMMRTSLTPSVNAIGTMLILLSVGSTVLALRLTRYRP